MPRSDIFPQSAVAIIGMAGRFPDAPDLDAFWRNLVDGVESITTFTDEELLAAGVPAELIADPNYVKKGTYLQGADLFDASFFGLNAREAEILDPQQRIFLECAWEAIEDAGYICDRYPGLVSVFAGTSINTYLLANLLANPAVLETVGAYQVMVANDKDFLATRVNYKLNLRGAGMTVQTACSTSLVAVQLAWQSLLDGQCDLALAGGVSAGFPQKAGYLYQEGMIFSPDGHCRPFDEKGQGIRGGSGAGVIVLKRLADALADGDPIRAVLLGAAVNNDGAGKMGYTAPSLDGQAEVIALAQARAEVDPGTITYVEAHATATPLGDPIEVGALSQVFRAGTTRRGFCGLGSLKSNLGHLDAAAGIAGLIKTVLSLEHKLLPPTLNFQRLNPQIDFQDTPFYINDTLKPWTTDGHPRRAGVSSFGIGGTNAHAVLEEAPAQEPSVVNRPAHILVLSARTPTALDSTARNLATYLSEHPDVSLADVAYTLQVGRKRFEYRRTIVGRSVPEAIAALTRHDAAKTTVNSKASTAPPIAFLFSGQGSQYAGMGRELYHADPTYRAELDRCAEGLMPHLGRDIRELILTPLENGADSPLNQTRFAQPALFACEYALARTWMAWGIRPTAMLGHSIGEYVAACVSGVLSLDDALRLVAERGRLMQEMPAGRMIAVPLSEAEVKPLLDTQLSLAAVNAPQLCVVAGPADAVATLERRLAALGIECRPLHTSHAFHSSMMEPVLPRFREALDGITLGTPEIPYISNLTGTWVTPAETQSEYWTKHLRNAVRFADGVQALAKIPGMIFLEVGPGKTLATLTRQTLGVSGHEILASLPHPLDEQPDVNVIFQTVGQLWSAGAEIDWKGVHAGERLHRLSLPTYPFERQRYLVEPQRLESTPQSPRLQKNVDLTDWFYFPSWARVAGPVERGEVLAPREDGVWLLFLDECGVGAKLAERLRSAGHTCFTVRQGRDYQQVDHAYTIRPEQKGDYDRCVTEIKARANGAHIRRVMHLWSVTTPGQDVEVEHTLDTGVFSVIYLLQALSDVAFGDPLDVAIVSNGVSRVIGNETLSPAKATALAPAMVAPREFPWLRCQSIDIDPTEIDGQLIEQLLLETAVGTQSSPVAYRGGYRWTERFEPTPLPAREGIPARLRARGVYLITGGLGGLGLVTAKFLAETVQARLILTGRSTIPPKGEWTHWLASHDDTDVTSQRIRSIQELESLGAEVLVGQADVADRDAMERVVAQGRQHFGPIHGVFHAAGIAGGSSLQMLTRPAAAHVFVPKIGGTLVLDALFKDSELELFVLFSSINAVIGTPASTDYTASNLFLDAYAMAHHGSKRAVLAIDWDAWRDVGMAASAVEKVSHKNLGDLFHHAIESEEGAEVLRRVLALSVPRVVVVTRDLTAQIAASHINEVVLLPLLAPSNGEQTPDSGLSHHTRPDLAQSFVAPQTEQEQVIAALWQELLGIDQVGIDDDFFELGGHSLIATSLLTRIQREYSVKLPLRTIFEAPTVRTLAERVTALVWALQTPVATVSDENREEFEI